MARSLDIETLVEDAFLANLPTYDASSTVVRWDDIKHKTLTPSVKIKATLVDDEEGTLNLYCASNVLVDIAAFTSRKIDEDGKTANGMRAEVRNFINQDDIVDTLNLADGLLVYKNGVIPQTSSDGESDKVWQKMTSVLVVATTTESSV